MGIVSLDTAGVYIVITIIHVFQTIFRSIEAVMVDYSLEQGKIQKELLHELEIPYAILDTTGHIMWANNMFHEIIGFP